MKTAVNKTVASGALWRPAVLLPSQSAQHNGCSGELRLATAILEDAFRCIQKNASARRGPRAQEFREARQWFTDQSRDWPFAFTNICDILALDASAVRKRVERIVARATPR